MSYSPAHNTRLNLEQFEEILIYFTTSIHKKNTEEDVLWDLAKNCIAKLGFVDCVIYLTHQQSQKLIQKAAYGSKNPKDYEIYQPVQISIGEGITGTVAQTGKPEIVSDTSKDSRYIEDDERRYSEICVPITANEEILGVIDCEHPEKNFFTEQHLRILKTIASICGIKLNQIRAEKRIKTEQEKHLKIQKEMVDLKLKAFRSQMNPHFIFNALSSIQYFITSGNKKLALNYLSVFSKLIRFYLKNIENDTVNLTDEITMLKGYLSLQKLRYTDQFSYELLVEEISKDKNASIPSFVLQTLFENIIEHAIFNQYKNYSVRAKFSVDEQNVSVKIVFNYDLEEKNSVKYIPQYREQIMKWQDQIRFLKKLKNYNIKKKVSFDKPNKSNGGTILVSLPNVN